MEKLKTYGIKTTFQCHRCDNHLVLIEDKRNDVMFFGCPRCDCYVIVPSWRLKEFKHGNYFNWRKLMKYAYHTYLEARDMVCQ